MSSTAYIVAFIDTTQKPPAITRAGIYSESHPTSELRRAYPVPVTQITGDNFGDAIAQAKEWLQAAPGMEWLRDLVFPSGVA